MEIIYVDDFISADPSLETAMENISTHCHFTPSDEIWVYVKTSNIYLACYDNKVTYPKVTYAEALKLIPQGNLARILPDLKKIGRLSSGYADIADFGNIQEINYFSGMSNFYSSDKRKQFNLKTKCIPLDYDLYRFKSKKGSWDIKVNKHS